MELQRDGNVRQKKARRQASAVRGLRHHEAQTGPSRFCAVTVKNGSRAGGQHSRGFLDDRCLKEPDDLRKPGLRGNLGPDSERILTLHRTNGWTPSILKTGARIIDAALAKQISGKYDEVYRIVRPDGSIRWIQDWRFPFRDESGKVYRVVGIAEDITESKTSVGRAARKMKRGKARSCAWRWTPLSILTILVKSLN